MALLGKQYVGRLNLVEEAQTEDLTPTQVLTRDEANGDIKTTPVSFFATDQDLNNKADLVDGKVPASQLPSYVDDVLEFANLASFPVTGESGKIYVALDTNKTYRWGGSSYVEISPSLALGETSSTAYRGDRGKIAYDHTFLTNNPHAVTAAQVGLGNVNNTSDADKPISTAQAAVNALKANDADVVHKTGNLAETITGYKTFTGTTMFSNITIFEPDFPAYFNGTNMVFQYSTGLGGVDFAKIGVQNGLLFIKDGSFNVGFNNTNPQYKIDVNGTGRVTGDFIAGNVQTPILLSGVAESSISTTDGSSDSTLVTKNYLTDTVAKARRKVYIETGLVATVVPSTATVYRLNSTTTDGVSVVMPVISGNTGVSIIIINNSPVNSFVRANTLPNTDLWENGQLVTGVILPPGKTMTLINDSLKWVVMDNYKSTQILTKTANYQILVSDYIGGELSLFVDASGGNRTITLENRGNMVGKKVRIIKTDSSLNSVTIQGDANINGASTFLLTGQYQNVQIEATATQYWITN